MMDERAGLYRPRWYYPAAALLLLLPLYQWLFGIPGSGVIGDDYSYFLPHLLDGYYWYLNNGLGEIPWFSPAFCAGLPAYANPQNFYYSLPQLLTLFLGPLTAIQATQLLVAGLGFIGCYLLLLRRCGIILPYALLGAALFMFNGFFASRMAMGHLTFHGVMLLPWFALLLSGRYVTLRIKGAAVVLSGLLFAYLIYAGMVALLLQMIVAVWLLLLLLARGHRELWYFSVVLMLAVLLGMLVGGSKLLAVITYMQVSPRNGYPLPGFSQLVDLLLLPIKTLFISPQDLSQQLVNLRWDMTPASFNYGLSLVPLLIIVLLGLRAVRQGAGVKSILLAEPVRYLLILALLLVPLLLNLYQPVWNQWLKSLPLIGQSSNNLRWMILYLLPVLMLAMWLLSRISLKPWQSGGLALSLFVLACGQLHWNYQQQATPAHYTPDGVEQAYLEAKQQQQVPWISFVGGYRDGLGRMMRVLNRNDLLARGGSILNCYEPMFGYELEWFPASRVEPGSVWTVGAERQFNFHNPSCFLFPEENSCSPGERFSTRERQSLDQLLRYQPLAFVKSRQQQIADMVSLLALLLGLAWLIWSVVRRG